MEDHRSFFHRNFKKGVSPSGALFYRFSFCDEYLYTSRADVFDRT